MITFDMERQIGIYYNMQKVAAKKVEYFYKENFDNCRNKIEYNFTICQHYYCILIQ